MRKAFIEALCRLAEQDPRIWLLTGDLGYSVLEAFARAFPERYVNVGVAEQNMTGVAAGLALCGKIPVTYSIANFPIFRCLEQIRNDVCYHHLSVKIVSVGGGLAYGSAGYTHHGVEDLAVMRALPEMKVLAPGDPVEVRLCVEAMVRSEGPCFLRLGKGGEDVVHEGEPDFHLGRAITLFEGEDVSLLSTGGILGVVVAAANELRARGLSPTVMSIPSLVPLPAPEIVREARHTGRLVTIEEHGPGGLGTAVAELLALEGVPAAISTLRLGHEAATAVGSQSVLRSGQGLSVAGIVTATVELVSSKVRAGSGSRASSVAPAR